MAERKVAEIARWIDETKEKKNDLATVSAPYIPPFSFLTHYFSLESQFLLKSCRKVQKPTAASIKL